MLEISTHKDITIAKFKNITRFNYIISQNIKDDLTEILQKNNCKLILDFKGIEFIDSSAIGVLILVVKKSKQNSGKFVFCNVSNQVLDLIQIMQLESVFQIYSTLEEAISKI